MQANPTGFNTHYAEDTATLEQVRNLAGDAILEFGAPWCGHCQAAQAAVEEAMIGHNNVPHIKVYDGKGKRLGRAFKVKLWPTVIKLHNGEEVARLVRPLLANEIKQLMAQQ